MVAYQTKTNQQKRTTMSLMIHCGAEMKDEEYLANLAAAENKTNTHVAVDHAWYVNRIKDSLDNRRINYEDIQVALTPDNESMFGTMELPDFCVPSIDAQYQLFKQTKLSDRNRHSLLVQMAKQRSLPTSNLLKVEKEYLREDEDVMRDVHSYGHNVWRLLQAFTHQLQRGGRFGNDQTRLDAVATRTQQVNILLRKFCDPTGSKMREILEEPQLLNDGFSLSLSYRYILGFRNDNRLRFPAGMVLGVGVFVCDNLCFSGEVQLRRKHTRYIKRDLPPMISNELDKLMLGGIIAG